MSLYEQIRKAHEREKLGIRQLSRRFGVHRRDIRQALACAVPPPRKPPSRRPASPLEPWKPLIEQWLEEDRRAPRKQRHTAHRIWQRLVEEHGARVGESTVRRYVASVKARHEIPPLKVMVPQHHLLGAESEVDFGTSSVYLAGSLTDVHLFIMRLSASGRGLPARISERVPRGVLGRACPGVRALRRSTWPHPLRQLEDGCRKGPEGKRAHRVRTGSSRFARTTGSTASSACQESTAPMRKVASRERSEGSEDAISCPSRGWTRWRS